ncbi:MAG TPA: TlpA disulfide reductase family protein [Bryobacteraceae bacterium]|nr:TlpA disulfide reductase family protein [Bryobacteraceae bacterium]
MKILIAAVSVALLTSAAWGQQKQPSIAGLWDATITWNDAEIPFKLEISGSGSNVKGWFFNGDDREISNSGTFENGSLILNFDSYLAKLTATVKDGALDGEYGPMLKKMSHIHAVRATAKSKADPNPPSIAGQWDLNGINSSKGEKAWRLILRQNGGDIQGAILRVDGDTGTLTGSYKDGKFVLSHFSGARPALMIIQPERDGTMQVKLSALHGFSDMKAVRPEEARAKGLPEPTDADEHTSVKDPNQPFPFSFPDLNGKIVSNTDGRFRGKVVLINITGSWCPNCHDEAPFLAAMYDKYHAQGLEVVALSFEEADQLKNPTRLRAFIKEYGIKYTVLLGGETETAKEKLTQAVNWDAWPTTFFVGRDGLVRGVHAGFPGPASGVLYKKETEEFTAKVEKLLAENQTSSR